MDQLEINNYNTRENEWISFSNYVLNHIKNYTVPQYGDLNLQDPSKGDQMQNSSLEDIKMNLLRYVNRLNSNARGSEETIRDLLKIAHYSCILYGKYKRNEIQLKQLPIVEINKDITNNEILTEINKYYQQGYKEIKIKVI